VVLDEATAGFDPKSQDKLMELFCPIGPRRPSRAPAFARNARHSARKIVLERRLGGAKLVHDVDLPTHCAHSGGGSAEAAQSREATVQASPASLDLSTGRHKQTELVPWRPVSQTLMPRRRGSVSMWKLLWDEAREAMWLASIIGALSALGVGLAIALAAA
jgi:hypothetical protein